MVVVAGCKGGRIKKLMGAVTVVEVAAVVVTEVVIGVAEVMVVSGDKGGDRRDGIRSDR